MVRVTESEPDSAVDAALQDLAHAYERAASAIEETPDPQAAFRRATRLVEQFGGMYQAAGELRSRMAIRIFESRTMSLAGLADVLGVSKQRAHQFVRKGDQDGN